MHRRAAGPSLDDAAPAPSERVLLGDGMMSLALVSWSS
jgi:hypothetical protein